MYRIKQQPQDFIVEEICKLPEGEREGEDKEIRGKYSYFLLSKQGHSTHHALKLIGSRLGILPKQIGYAGLKDRNAETTQLISIRNAGRERTENLNLNKITLKLIGKGSTPVTLGCLEGNRFIITIRNLTGSDTESLCKNISQLKANEFLIPNYFGEQRFGTSNHAVGKAILTGDFGNAARLITENGNNTIEAYLSEHKNDHVGSLKTIPRKLALLYIHSYQALVFNKTAASLIKSEYGKCREIPYSEGIMAFPDSLPENEKEALPEMLPITGFSTDLSSYNEEIRSTVSAMLERDGITLRNFVIRSIPELSCEGGERELFMHIKDFSHALHDDELNPGMQKCILKFALPKGSYATVLIKFLLG